jgi:quercetin dioxygenase-like cupin family protein
MNGRNKVFAAIALGMLASGLYSARGVAQTTAAPGPVGTVLQMSSEVTNLNMPADFTAFNRITYVAPGGGVPLHWHPGPFTLLVLEGELTAITRGVEKVYKTGDSWTDGVGPDSAHELWNRGKIMAKYSLMGVLPKGAPVSTFVTK